MNYLMRRWSRVLFKPRSRYRRQFRLICVSKKNFLSFTVVGTQQRNLSVFGHGPIVISVLGCLSLGNLSRLRSSFFFHNKLVFGLLGGVYRRCGWLKLLSDGFFFKWRRYRGLAFKEE